MRKPAVNYHEELMRALKNPEEASAYLNAALEAGDKKAFLLALRNVIEAHGGMTRISDKSKMNRVSLYKMLSRDGNPSFENVLHLLQTVGIRFRISLRPNSKARHSSRGHGF